ncbi:hypothetical protein HJC23_013305 [Cyclotella cryptica]|uniref:PH domain-containing protein n=1 Tax=Cyclotella cryptica TaxID=29204 RepID=A0ABD3Q0J9_9STRA
MDSPEAAKTGAANTPPKAAKEASSDPSEMAQTIAASAIATALHSTCFQPPLSSPASTPLRSTNSAFVAAPPDWSALADPSSSQKPAHQQGQQQQQYRSPQRLGSTESQGSKPEAMFPVPFAQTSSGGSGGMGSAVGPGGVSRSYDNSPRGGASIATSFSGSASGTSQGPHPQQQGPVAVASGALPLPPFSMQPPPAAAMVPQLSLSRSGDTLNSNPQNLGLNSSINSSMSAGNANQLPQQQQRGGGVANADASVLLGLEELERQQADLEKRRANEAARNYSSVMHCYRLVHPLDSVAVVDRVPACSEIRSCSNLTHFFTLFPRLSTRTLPHHGQCRETLRKQQEQNQRERERSSTAYSTGLPPLAPVLSGESAHYPDHDRRRTPGGEDVGINVPSQIHLMDEEETLTSEVTDKGLQGDMKRVTSIEKLGKLRGQMSVSLRRFRSWSLSATNDNPVGSVDSTQNATMSRASGVGVEAVQQSSATIQEPYLDDGELKPLIYGYLHKLGRNGHWQKRFFETNGERLTYYKSVKRTKVLATLDLCKVGEIAIDKTDPEACTFTIQVSNRPYYLRAEDKTQCNDWVITLNRAREARMNVGNIQLVTPKLDDPHRSQAGSDEYAPCIVISALRARTHGSDLPPDLLTCQTEEEQQQIEVMGNWDHFQTRPTDAAVNASPKKSLAASSPVASQPMAKWQKKHSTMHQLSVRFLKWARSITKQADACRREKDVVVVPAHVLRSINQQNLTSPAASGIQGTSSARRKVSGSGSDLPVLAEEAPIAGRGEGPNRSRTSTESTAGGIGGSQYV